MKAHPAKFSDPIVSVIHRLLADLLPYGSRVLDPFAGVGGVHRLWPFWETWGVEIEHEWACQHPRTIVGDSRFLPFPRCGSFGAVVTSPTYANRMADHHNAREKCRACQGTGVMYMPEPEPVPVDCPKCGGEGRREYKRLTYRHQLGRELTPGNSGGMQWGPEYRELHRQVYAECRRAVVMGDGTARQGGLFVLNVSNHIRAKREVDVTEWHISTLQGCGFREVVAREEVRTARMGFGANRLARVPFETVAVLR